MAGREASEGGTAERADPETERPVLGVSYREAQVTEPPGNPEPFSIDPALVERGLRGHVTPRTNSNTHPRWIRKRLTHRLKDADRLGAGEA
jgi:hypothetical protein